MFMPRGRGSTTQGPQGQDQPLWSIHLYGVEMWTTSPSPKGPVVSSLCSQMPRTPLPLWGHVCLRLGSRRARGMSEQPTVVRAF